MPQTLRCESHCQRHTGGGRTSTEFTLPCESFAVKAPAKEASRLAVLDRWRDVRALRILPTHLRPLGPEIWHPNEFADPMAMALFFTPLGFLITWCLLSLASVPNFYEASFPLLHLTDVTSHFGSLCAELKFCVGIALVVAEAGRRGINLWPAICDADTFRLVPTGVHFNIVTWRQVDENLGRASINQTEPK